LTSARLDAFLDELNTTGPIRGLYQRYGLPYGWLAMMTITLANVATLMTGTIINVAIPDIMGAFGIGQDKAQWLATAFLASSTITMLMNSWIIQNIGMRYTVLAAMSVFMAGSVLGGMSPNPDLLTMARVLQGAATGVITPMGMSLVFQLFPPGRQGTVIGVTTVGVVLAPALGPLLGGILIDSFNWRYVYLMGIPVSLVVLPMALFFMPPRDPNAIRRPLDWLGLLLVSSAICSLLIGLSNGQREGWNSNFVLLCLAVAAISTYLFITWEQHTRYPLLDLRVFRFFRFNITCLLGFIFGAGLYGSTYLIPLFLQIVQQLTPTDTGLMMLPAALAMGFLFPISGRLSDRIDHRLLLGSGFLVVAWSSLLMVNADINTSWATFAWWLVVSRIGIGIMAPVINLSAIQSLPLEHLQQGAGAMNFIRQLGGAFGVNLLSVALDFRTSFHRDALFATQTYGHSDTMALIVEIQKDLVGAGLTFWEQQAVAYGMLGKIVSQQAMVYAFQDCFLFLTGLFLFSLVPLGMLRRHHMRTPH
jgi:DHA2 family multidrug resistance protein